MPFCFDTAPEQLRHRVRLALTRAGDSWMSLFAYFVEVPIGFHQLIFTHHAGRIQHSPRSERLEYGYVVSSCEKEAVNSNDTGMFHKQTEPFTTRIKVFSTTQIVLCVNRRLRIVFQDVMIERRRDSAERAREKLLF